MGTIEIFRCLFLGHFIAAQSVIKKQDVPNFQNVPRFFNNIRPFPFERNFDFTPFDTIFSSWGTQIPDFHMLAELPPIVIVPRVEVFCDESKITLLVDKRSNDVLLTGEELQLGNGCYSNKELPNQFVFSYNLDECGTTPVMQNGLVMFTNALHLNLKKPPPTWWQTPSTVHIFCLPKRSYSMAFPEGDQIFNIKAMNPSWTSSAESILYERGQVVNLQISAKTRPEQQLFIQSCFVSASPEPQTRPKHALIMNKGCTAPLDSSHAVIQFVASDRADVVNLVLDTSYLISELYIHCSVLMSDQGVNFGSKACNYNLIQSRWEDLSGNVEVCECCSSKCKGLSVKHLPEDAKATISIGPFVIVDSHVEPSPEPSEPEETSSAPVTDSMWSHGAATEDKIVSGSSASKPPQGVVVVSQDPGAGLTLWLPGQLQDPEHSKNIHSESGDHLTLKLEASNTIANDLPELRLLADKEPLLNTLINEMEGQSANELGREGPMWDLNLLTLVNGWAIPSQMEEAVFAEESQRKKRVGRSGVFDTQSPQEVAIPLTDEIVYVDVLNQNDYNQMRHAQPGAAVMTQEEASDAQPIIRSKLQFSKGTDGSRSLSYEEEVMRQRGKREPRRRGLRSTFLDLLRRMDKAE